MLVYVYIIICSYIGVLISLRLSFLLSRATNMKGQDALLQLMQKCNRLEFFQDSGMMTATRDVQCGNCSESGHYHCSCLKSCKRCGFVPYAGHLG